MLWLLLPGERGVNPSGQPARFFPVFLPLPLLAKHDPKNQATSIPYNCIFETLNYHQLAETPNHRHIHTESTKKFIPQTATPAPAKKQRPLKSRWICWLYLRHWQCRQHFSSRKLCVQGLQAWHFYQKCIGNVCAVAAPPPLHQTVFFLPFFKGVLSKSSSRSG